MTVRVTIKDIARELKIHHSTVSRALRDDKRVKPETKKKIVEYAKDHGYQVNMSALHLRGSIRNVIAIIVPNINHQFFSNIISQITNLANENGYVVSIFQSNENYHQEKDIIDTIIQNNVAGVIASVSMETLNGEHFSELAKYKIPLVFFDRVCDIDVPKVIVNNYEIVMQAVDLMIRKGYKRIVHVTGTSLLNVFRERQRGYSDAVNLNKLDYHQIYKVEKGFAIDDGKEAAKQLFSKEERPDAILCDSYNLLLGIISYLDEIGVEIPGDVGLVGFGENPSMEVIKPRITAIVQPDAEVAKWTYKILVEKMNNGDENVNESIMLSSKIVERDSC